MRKKAYITGASSGIGKEFALQLKESHDLVLIARNQVSLDDLKLEIESKVSGINVEALSLDLTKDKDCKKLYKKLIDDKDLDLLVNNAGFGTVGEFAEIPIEEELKEIQLNVSSLVELTHAGLINLKKKKSGGIINVASLAAYLPAPYSATYAATKAFVNSFTESIHEEAISHGVVVQSLCPGLTHSDFHQRAGIEKSNFPNFLWMDSVAVVKESLKSLKKKHAVCIPGGVNQTAIGLTNIVPNFFSRKLAGKLMKQ
ncbi:MAG: SDR family NAD(P)-dependent oxidoreductase [Leptospira sp.]|nr:SDR family NAD(P)-dependent oxidoreductase [Leptospira sp.]